MHQRADRRGAISFPLILTLFVVVLAVAGGFLWLQAGSDYGEQAASDHFRAQRGGFEIIIPTSGELNSMQQIEIRNRLETRAVVMEIIDEGKTVSKGDLLMHLDDEDLRNRIKDAEDTFRTAEAQFTSAEATLAIRKSTAASEIDRAKLQVELAHLALEAWEKGEVEARRQDLKLELETAEINFERLDARYEDSQRLHEQEFISGDELQRDRISRIEARARLQQARLDIEVYENYTYVQQEKQKRSDVEQAAAELERVKQRHAAEIDTARADLESRRYSLDSRRERYQELVKQLEYTTVRAPADGLVVYASSIESSGRRGSPDPPQVGTELSRNELVMVLPDTSRMLAVVRVNEALSGMIEPGQRARVTSDARPGQSVEGEVLSVGVLAETGGWRDPNRRDYTVRILLTGENHSGLRPSMRCRAEILVDEVQDALHIPVHAVHRQRGQSFVYVPTSDGYVARPVDVGRSSEMYAEITSGLEEHETVLLRRPNANEVVSERRRGREQPDEQSPERSPEAPQQIASSP